MKLYMFRTVRLSIIRSLFTVHSAMIYLYVYKPVWNIPLLSVQWINSWWWTDELPETCRISWQNKFVKLVHLVGFITKNDVRCVWADDVLSLNGTGEDSERLWQGLTVRWGFAMRCISVQQKPSCSLRYCSSTEGHQVPGEGLLSAFRPEDRCTPAVWLCLLFVTELTA